MWKISSHDEAGGYIAFQCEIAEETNIQTFIDFVKTIRKHWSGILNYFKSGLNNGILEGINSKIQLAKKRARGFRNINNFINMIQCVAGKMQLGLPDYFTHSIQRRAKNVLSFYVRYEMQQEFAVLLKKRMTTKFQITIFFKKAVI